MKLNLTRRAVGALQRLNTVRRVRIDAILNIERLEGIDVHSQLDPLADREGLIQRDLGGVVERSRPRRLGERIRSAGPGEYALSTLLPPFSFTVTLLLP